MLKLVKWTNSHLERMIQKIQMSGAENPSGSPAQAKSPMFLASYTSKARMVGTEIPS
jgi:hypothetical protein